MVETILSKSQLPIKAAVNYLNFYYGGTKHALKDVTMPVCDRKVTALIGPSGCGKTTLLRCFNRMHDLYPGNKYRGEISLEPDGINLLSSKIDPIEVRMRISMVFQRPNPFPKSIYENVAYGLRVRGEKRKRVIDDKLEMEPGTALSGGQQQRLCIARALATEPEIVLFDEPTSALDPIATDSIEQLINELKDQVTILIVTHSMQQAARVSDFTAFMYLGELVEFDKTEVIFNNPAQKQTADYISGRFG
jgi:phosphate transport system ATP-binding protein